MPVPFEGPKTSLGAATRSLWPEPRVCERISRRGASVDAWVRRPGQVGWLPRVPMLWPEGSATTSLVFARSVRLNPKVSSWGPCEGSLGRRSSTRRSASSGLHSAAPCWWRTRPEGVVYCQTGARPSSDRWFGPKTLPAAGPEPVASSGESPGPKTWLSAGLGRWLRLVNGSVRRPHLPPGLAVDLLRARARPEGLACCGVGR